MDELGSSRAILEIQYENEVSLSGKRGLQVKQAEKVMDELGSSRAILEIQYENEVSVSGKRGLQVKQAEKVMDELGSSRAILEIQYENEVSVSRKRGLQVKQAEKVMDEMGSSRAILEIQYENECVKEEGITSETSREGDGWNGQLKSYTWNTVREWGECFGKERSLSHTSKVYEVCHKRLDIVCSVFHVVKRTITLQLLSWHLTKWMLNLLTR